MLEYRIVAQLSIPDVSREVNVAIADGWTPCGGVATGTVLTPSGNRLLPPMPQTLYIQAITREKQP